MEIFFKKFILKLDFEKEVYFGIYPPFIYRSVLGKELKKLSCIKTKQNCTDCDLKFQCIYSKIFETPISKENEVIKNRNFATHPFLLSTNKNIYDKAKNIELNLTLIGYALDYLPYIYFALKKGGEKGIFKNRVKFKIASMTADNKELIKDEENISQEFKKNIWVFNTSEETKLEHLIISLVSPLRMKINGKYQSRFNYKEFLNTGYRRLDILSKLYGINEIDNKDKINIDKICIPKKNEFTNLAWHDLERYSARQKTALKMGGVIGQMDIEGDFSLSELSILKGIENFHIGKNTSFGLGKIKTMVKGSCEPKE